LDLAGRRHHFSEIKTNIYSVFSLSFLGFHVLPSFWSHRETWCYLDLSRENLECDSVICYAMRKSNSFSHGANPNKFRFDDG